MSRLSVYKYSVLKLTSVPSVSKYEIDVIGSYEINKKFFLRLNFSYQLNSHEYDFLLPCVSSPLKMFDDRLVNIQNSMIIFLVNESSILQVNFSFDGSCSFIKRNIKTNEIVEFSHDEPIHFFTINKINRILSVDISFKLPSLFKGLYLPDVYMSCYLNLAPSDAFYFACDQPNFLTELAPCMDSSI